MTIIVSLSSTDICSMERAILVLAMKIVWRIWSHSSPLCLFCS